MVDVFVFLGGAAVVAVGAFFLALNLEGSEATQRVFLLQTLVILVACWFLFPIDRSIAPALVGGITVLLVACIAITVSMVRENSESERAGYHKTDYFMDPSIYGEYENIVKDIVENGILYPPAEKGGSSDVLYIDTQTIQSAFDRSRDLLTKVKKENEELKEKYQVMDRPYVATTEIRERVARSLSTALDLHRQANARTVLFQNYGIAVICFGLLAILGHSIWIVYSDREAEDLKIIAPIVGIVFNVVGTGLILFHKTAAKTAMDYYDRSQALGSQLTALGLVTSRVMEKQIETALPRFIESLYTNGVKTESRESPNVVPPSG